MVKCGIGVTEGNLRQQTKILVVGFGSIGKRHAQVGTALGHEVSVVDPRIASEDGLPSGVRFYESLLGLDEAFFDYCVIANWGPDHVPTMLSILDSGISKLFVIEKPMAASFSEIKMVRQRVLSGDVKFLVAASKHFCGLDMEVADAMSSEPTSISIFGGAQCMSTIGYHWLDFAIRLFGCNPVSVFADLNDSPINPRGAHLSYIEGTAVYKFPNGRRLTMTFDNRSSISAVARVLGRNQLVEISGETVVSKIRDDKLLLEDDRVTRTATPGKLNSRRNLISLEEGMRAMHKTLLDSPPDLDSMSHDFSVAEYMLLALESSDAGSKLSLDGFMSKRQSVFTQRAIS